MFHRSIHLNLAILIVNKLMVEFNTLPQKSYS